MKRPLCYLLFLGVLSACSAPSEDTVSETPVEDTDSMQIATIKDTTPKVTGIGGVFFGTDDPKETREWYGEHLGLAIDDFGSPFEFRNANDPNEINYLRWSPMSSDDPYFEPSEKEFMINYRVQNIDGLVRNLKEKGVEVLDSIASYPYGKFVHVQDPFGNKIELWEPIDSVLTQMGGVTTK